MAIASKTRIKRTFKTSFTLVMYRLIFKRLFDILVAIMVLVVMFPIIFVASLILLFQNKGKVFFFQERPGLHQKAFRIIKFKTMTDEKDNKGILLPDNQRITKAGKIIRRLSIDELPQLINVLNGDMSLVGPRPLLFKYIPLYSEAQQRRHNVRPGITGWAQVNGRNSISWTKKFELDVFYVEHLSFQFDIKILWKTFIKVIKTEGVNQSDAQPMQPFDGTN
ncbi:sugar transferase [Flavobacterium sp.]|uniref:sugar transferase n=1 Tax=Flavobacterium sp. TaxID=239 RepID=UPI00391CFE2F